MHFDMLYAKKIDRQTRQRLECINFNLAPQHVNNRGFFIPFLILYTILNVNEASDEV